MLKTFGRCIKSIVMCCVGTRIEEDFTLTFLALQEFSFLIYHISGKDNVEADVLSRLYDRSKEFMF